MRYQTMPALPFVLRKAARRGERRLGHVNPSRNAQCRVVHTIISLACPLRWWASFCIPQTNTGRRLTGVSLREVGCRRGCLPAHHRAVRGAWLLPAVFDSSPYHITQEPLSPSRFDSPQNQPDARMTLPAFLSSLIFSHSPFPPILKVRTQ
jgi:hypothetical protein